MNNRYNYKSLQNLYKNIGLNIKFYRKLRNITQADLAEQAGLSHEYIRKIEAKQGKKSLSLGTMYKFSEILDVNIEDLIKPNEITIEQDLF